MEGSVLDGRYEIRSCLGKGGMGVVYEAYDRALEERVAIKVLRGHDAGDPASARRFRSEIKLARKVTHRNVCRIHDYGEDGAVQYISMQLLEGTDLRTRLKNGGPLGSGEACAIAIQIAEGLQAVHDEGIVHRDLKTANVMIDGQGVARLMDFGIAKAGAGGESLTATGNIVGTPEYMSPEQIRGEPVDARSDLYSLGVILFELFTGRLPFTSDSAVGTLMKHLQDQPPLDAPEAGRIPPALRTVIRAALAKDREQRYRSAAEVARALRDALASPAAPPPTRTQPSRAPTAVPALPPTAIAPPRPSVAPAPAPPRRRGHALPWLVAVAVAVPLAGWIGWTARQPGRSPAPSAPALTLAPAPSPSARPIASDPNPPATTHATPAVAAVLDPACAADDAAACRRACEAGAAAACSRLGVLYNSGRGVGKDVATAAEYYERGCSGGDGGGCNNLGTLFEFGLIGIDKDPGRAAAFYRRACDAGDAKGCANLRKVSDLAARGR